MSEIYLKEEKDFSKFGSLIAQGIMEILSENDAVVTNQRNDKEIYKNEPRCQRNIILHDKNGDKVVQVERSAPVNIYIDNSIHTTTTNVHETHTRVENRINIGDSALRFISNLFG